MARMANPEILQRIRAVSDLVERREAFWWRDVRRELNVWLNDTPEWHAAFADPAGAGWGDPYGCKVLDLVNTARLGALREPGTDAEADRMRDFIYERLRIALEIAEGGEPPHRRDWTTLGNRC